MVSKSDIKQHFQKSRSSYDNNAHVQKMIVKRFKELLAEFLPDKCRKVLEIGCGTGLLTRELRNMSDIELFINDIVDEVCFETASVNNISDDHTIAGDIEHTDLPGVFDTILSTSTFQWLADPKETFNRLASHLTPEGIMIFSSFGKDNFKELREVTGNGLYYYNRVELENLLSGSFKVIHFEENRHVLHFTDPVEILKHLKNTGVNAVKSEKQWVPKTLKEFVARYTQTEDGCPLTYHPLYIVAQRK
ncbi:malonyl-ACP O-methyltransferase BioC [Odoribacter sp. OttesenSCG-928-J03]|nr:malonyl-ACP O-methyltransferase BioC [Odoribacter sp. OttesenSCG-928-J03]